MPLAAPIPATHSSAAPILPANSRAHGKAASGQEFGELFRQKAEIIKASETGSAIGSAPPPSVAVTRVHKIGETGDPSALAQKTGATESADSESAAFSPVSGAPTEPAASGSEAPSSASQAALQARLTNQQEAGSKGKMHPAPGTAPASLPAASEELSKASKVERKKDSPAAPQTVYPAHKSKEANQTGKQAVESAMPLSPAASLPATVSSAVKTSPAPGGNPSATARQSASADQPASLDQTIPPAVASQAASPAQSSQSPAASISADVGSQGATHAAKSPGGDSKASPESPSVESASAAPHTGHAFAASAASEATGAPSSAIAAEARPGSTETAAPPPLEQPAAVAPAAGSAPAPAVSLYDKIDQSASPLVLHSGAQHVSVGVRDPDLGWVEIKTQNVTGHVDATLVAASSQAHSSLAAHLPAIAEYLQQRDVRVGTLAVQQPLTQANAGGGQGNGSGSGNGTGAGGGSAQSFTPSGSPHQDNASRSPGVTAGSRLPSGSNSDGMEDRNFSLRPVSYISVRA